MDCGQITDQTDEVWLSHRVKQPHQAPGSSRTSLYDTTFQGFAVVHISLVDVDQAATVFMLQFSTVIRRSMAELV